MAFDYKEYSRKYYEKNKEKVKKRQEAHREDNKEGKKDYDAKRCKESKKIYNKKYREKNRDAIAKSKRDKYSKDSLFRMSSSLRSRTNQAIKNQGYTKKSKSMDILGAPWQEVSDHLEMQFTNGIEWSNYGEWHIDHIIPLSSANTEEELLKLAHYTNLQPLWAEDNLRKGNKLI